MSHCLTRRITPSRPKALTGFFYVLWRIMSLILSAYKQLSAPERVFVDNYVTTITREYEKKGESVALALSRPVPAIMVRQSGDMFNRPLVGAAITERLAQISAATDVTQSRIVAEYAKIAFFSLADIMRFDEYGIPIYEFENAKPETLAAIKTFKEGRDKLGNRTFHIESHGKQAALDKLALIYGVDVEGMMGDEATFSAVTDNDTDADAAAKYAKAING